MSLIKKIALYSFLFLFVGMIALLIGEIWFDIVNEETMTKILVTLGLVIVADVIVLAVLRDIKQEDDYTDDNLVK